jgi:spore maturation protein CgeB
MRILYAGTISIGSSTRTRQWALERLGHEVVPFETSGYEASNSLLRKIEFRLADGFSARRLNVDLLRAAERERPAIFWSDKVLAVRPDTLEALREIGITTVSYMIDNPFGPRRDPGWRMYLKALTHYDLHVTQRDVSVRDYTQRGARNVIKIQTAYEPTMHFPPPAGWSDRNRDRFTSFVGTPYDDRARMLAQVSAAGFAISVSGNRRAWTRALPRPVLDKIYFGEELYETEYREAIWKSRINLSFLTRSNQDEYTQKSFEIAGCGGFLLAERSDGHAAKFVEDEEAVFFHGVDELQEKIFRYLPDEKARRRIAAAGNARAVRDGYHNDRQVALILERAAAIAQQKQASISRC